MKTTALAGKGALNSISGFLPPLSKGRGPESGSSLERWPFHRQHSTKWRRLAFQSTGQSRCTVISTVHTHAHTNVHGHPHRYTGAYTREQTYMYVYTCMHTNKDFIEHKVSPGNSMAKRSRTRTSEEPKRQVWRSYVTTVALRPQTGDMATTV